jgi:hypothetical protein
MMQTDDDMLRALLKAALPPVHSDRPPGDMWPRVAARMSVGAEWTLADWSAATVVAGGLLLFPKWFWFLAYHL